MKILGKYLEVWGKEEVDRLIELGIEESHTIEFKRELDLDNLKQPRNRKKFLFNVAAFVNTDGGVIFFGIDDSDENGKNKGVALNVCPIEVENKDDLDLQISSIINTNLNPSYSHFKLHFIAYDDNFVIALELQKALGMPRMVTYSDTNKFYKRRKSGKYLVDTFELQNMFNESIQSRNAAEVWRGDRVRVVRNKEFIPNLNIEGSLFLHIIPFQSESELLDLTDQVKLTALKQLLRNKLHSSDPGFNLEGYIFKHLAYYEENKALVDSYFQLFRTGSIEFYSAGLVNDHHQSPNGHKIIQANSFEKDIITYINISLKIFELYELQFPFIILVSQMDLMNTVIKHGRSSLGMNFQPINRRKLFFPPTIIYDRTVNIPLLMKPIFDIFWQAGGYARSGNFEGGKWEIVNE